jgi:hypothetical protein
MLYIEEVLSVKEISNLLASTYIDDEKDLDFYLSKYKLKKYVNFQDSFDRIIKKYDFLSNLKLTSDYFNKLLRSNFLPFRCRMSSLTLNFVINKYYDNHSLKTRLILARILLRLDK